MLRLTLKHDDPIEIGDATIHLVQVSSGSQVRIAIDAPKRVKVLRKKAKEKGVRKAQTHNQQGLG